MLYKILIGWLILVGLGFILTVMEKFWDFFATIVGFLLASACGIGLCYWIGSMVLAK